MEYNNTLVSFKDLCLLITNKATSDVVFTLVYQIEGDITKVELTYPKEAFSEGRLDEDKLKSKWTLPDYVPSDSRSINTTVAKFNIKDGKIDGDNLELTLKFLKAGDEWLLTSKEIYSTPNKKEDIINTQSFSTTTVIVKEM